MFGRGAPEDKLRLAKLMQQSGDVVAMTGDAVNDAAAREVARIAPRRRFDLVMGPLWDLEPSALVGGPWPLAVVPDCAGYLHERMELLSQKLETIDALAATNDLPDAIVTASGLKITPLDASVPEAAQTLIDQCASLLPHVKITELLQEVDGWTNFTRHFTHIKSGEQARDKTLLLTAVLADAVNLGLSKMAESCPGTTHAKLSWLQAWHIRDETYSAALAGRSNADRWSSENNPNSSELHRGTWNDR